MNIKRIIYSLAGITLIFSILTCCSGETSRSKRKNEPVLPPKTLASATARLNSETPEMVDEETRLDSVFMTPDAELAYYYTLISRDRASISEQAFRAYIIPRILVNVHENNDLKVHRDSSIRMIFNYRDRNGEFITEISVGPENYN
jgi:hypothetical protein